MLIKNKVLASLELRNCGLSAENLCEVFIALEQNTTLTSLVLAYSMFDTQSLLGLSKLLIIVYIM